MDIFALTCHYIKPLTFKASREVSTRSDSKDFKCLWEPAKIWWASQTKRRVRQKTKLRIYFPIFTLIQSIWPTFSTHKLIKQAQTKRSKGPWITKSLWIKMGFQLYWQWCVPFFCSEGTLSCTIRGSVVFWTIKTSPTTQSHILMMPLSPQTTVLGLMFQTF